MNDIFQLQSIVRNHVVRSLLSISYIPFAVKLERQIVFELIKDYYLKSEHNSKTTIYKHCEGAQNDEVIKRYSRYLKYADYYRTINNKFLKEYAGADIPELTRPPMTKLEDRFKGVYLSEYQFLQLDCICDIPLLRDIISKRITSVKKISNTQLQDMLDEYRYTLLEEKAKRTNDKAYLMWAFNLFSLESRYQVLSVYKLASLLSEYNNCKSHEKFSDEEKAEMLKLFATYVVDRKYIIENTPLLIRLDIIGQLRPGNVTSKVQQYKELLQLKTTIKHSLSLRSDITELLSSLTLPEMCKFVDEEYHLCELLESEFEWSSKKELFVRELYDTILKDYPAPPIK